jgi:hypothetical protein
MTDLCATRPWWNRRDFLKSSAAVAAGVYAMRWGLSAAADIALEFDGAKALVNAILDGLLAGEAVRVSGLGIFNARPAHFSGTSISTFAVGSP